ncbi:MULTISPECIES: cysteine-rich KTR domain-containing protein [Bacillota]|nr:MULTISPECIES: cysteine-rich KTR domain-containing protein [Bacillota]MCB6647265.1 cysteine-rich KTR domain-containing protein [[Clostridium] scindens]MCU1840095.1 cysteine-rich KTR domain-containing protein [Enterococcus faecium]MCU1909272.1 cysteine-rich KTR domain-containing protein [Enterococcus faecium]
MRKDTELKKFPLYCPKCKQKSLIEAKDLRVTVITESDKEQKIRKCHAK